MSAGITLRADDGRILALDTDRWHREPTVAERDLLENMTGPVLDVGCGPGRLVVGLAKLGVVALGVDPAPSAVAAARRRGAAVLQRSVFDLLPGEGRWQAALLVDGNLGIGGDPVRLLRRCRRLLAPEGTVVVEVHPPGTGWVRHRARLESGGAAGPWFGWAEVGVDAVGDVAAGAGLRVAQVVHAGGEQRWFSYLTAAGGSSRAVA